MNAELRATSGREATPEHQPVSEPERLLVPYFWLAVLALMWGASFLLIKLAERNQDFSPFTVSLGRASVGALTVGAILALRRQRFSSPGLGRRLPYIGVMAIASSVLPWVAIAWGELHISTALASIFNATTPIWTAVLAYWVTPLERPSRTNYVGVAIAFVGTALLVGPSLVTHGVTGDVLGSLAVLGAALGYAAAALFQRRRLAGIDAQQAALWQLVIASAVMLAISLPELSRVHLHLISTAAVVVLGVGSSGAGYIIYYYLLNTLGGTRTSTVTFLLPLTAIVWGVTLLHEVLSLPALLAMAVILVGVVLTSRPARRGLRIREPAPERLA